MKRFFKANNHNSKFSEGQIFILDESDITTIYNAFGLFTKSGDELVPVGEESYLVDVDGCEIYCAWSVCTDCAKGPAQTTRNAEGEIEEATGSEGEAYIYHDGHNWKCLWLTRDSQEPGFEELTELGQEFIHELEGIEEGEWVKDEKKTLYRHTTGTYLFCESRFNGIFDTYEKVDVEHLSDLQDEWEMEQEQEHEEEDCEGRY